MVTMREQCRCVMHSESDRIVWDGSDCPLHYYQGGMMAEAAAQATIEGLRHDLALAREELVGLRQENRRLDAEADGAISLDGLKAAWEAAEVPTDDNPIREGDMLIEHFGPDAYHVYLAEGNYSRLPCAIRILSRAPRREPWADLGDKLAVEMPGIEDEPRIEALAKALYCEHGVRVTGGGE